MIGGGAGAGVNFKGFYTQCQLLFKNVVNTVVGFKANTMIDTLAMKPAWTLLAAQ